MTGLEQLRRRDSQHKGLCHCGKPVVARIQVGVREATPTGTGNSYGTKTRSFCEEHAIEVFDRLSLGLQQMSRKVG